MSIEVEVGLENFDKVPLLEKPKPKRLAEGWANPKWRWAAALGGTLVLAAATGLFLHFHARESTDDAQVDRHLAPISAKISGNVVEVLVDDNQPVKAGQVLVRIDPRDYQAKVDQERAAVAMAESQAQGAHVGVPLTKETTASGNSNAEAQLATAEADFARASLAYEQARTADLAYAHAELEKQHATFELAKSDLARMIPLAQKEEISKQQLDSFAANERVAESQWKADEQRLAQAERNVEISKAAMLAAGARVAQAKAALEDARANFKQVNIQHPHGRRQHGKCGGGTGQGESRGVHAAVELRDDCGAGGRSGHAQAGGGRASSAAGTGPADGRAAARRLGDGEFQGNAACQGARRAEGGNQGGYLWKNLHRTRGFHRRSNRRAAELASAGKRHGEFRESSAAHSREDRAGSRSSG